MRKTHNSNLLVDTMSQSRIQRITIRFQEKHWKGRKVRESTEKALRACSPRVSWSSSFPSGYDSRMMRSLSFLQFHWDLTEIQVSVAVQRSFVKVATFRTILTTGFYCQLFKFKLIEIVFLLRNFIFELILDEIRVSFFYHDLLWEYKL